MSSYTMITGKNLITNKNPTDKETTHSLVPKRLEGQVAIITGGARGIGEATVRLFTKHGAKVIIADIEDTLGTTLASSLSPPATFIHCDVRKEDDMRHLIDTTVTTFSRLDIFFNNAGILGSQSKPKLSITEFDAEEFDRVVAVNVRGTALGMKHAARVMVPRKRGSIISSASVAGLMGGLGPHGYTATKHAIVGLTKNVACELGKYGIRVNCISPFGVATWMLVNGWKENDEVVSCEEEEEEEEVEKMEEIVSEIGSLKGVRLKASDIAEAALYLASEESRYVSGHNLVVDGGFTASKNCLAL